jgi:uncharacterized protein YcbK (DUF882 family)
MEMNRRQFLTGMGAILATYAFPGIITASNSGQIYVPTIGNVNLNDKVINGGHFNWNEVTKYGQRIPEDLIRDEKIICPVKYVVQNIIHTAKDMEEIRHLFGDNPVTVISWYRPFSADNKIQEELKKQGKKAASDSQHMYGRAVDFTVKGMTPLKVAAKLRSYWGDRGGVGTYSSFTHVDNRGFNARWYG